MIFSPWIATVNHRFEVPANAVLFTAAFSFIMSLINIGSTTAFNAFLSVSVVALMATYTLSIACVLVKRLRGEPLPPARWRLFGSKPGSDSSAGALGKYGTFINVMALAYSIWAFFWSFWPIAVNPTPASMNWAVLIFGAVMIIAAVAFGVHARKTYEGPVAKVRKLDGDSIVG